MVPNEVVWRHRAGFKRTSERSDALDEVERDFHLRLEPIETYRSHVGGDDFLSP